MAGTNSDYYEDFIIDNTLRVGNKFLAIFTTNPNFETGAGGVEAVGGGYVRKPIVFTAALAGATANNAVIAWVVGTDILAATYKGWAVYDALGGGNLVTGDAYSADRTVALVGDILNHAVGAITYQMT